MPKDPKGRAGAEIARIKKTQYKPGFF